jgi:multiple antibiotic resistance protein
MDYAFMAKAFGAFFAIINPFVNLPIFLSLTSNYDIKSQRSLAIKIALFSLIMCFVILFAGSQIIGFFGITVEQFRIAGGLVLAHIAWNMLNGSDAVSHHGNSQERSQMQDLNGLAFYPITFPMIVGPGTIATIIIYTSQLNNIVDTLTIGSVILSVLFLLFVVLFFASYFNKVLTQTMRVIMTRLMGMILLAIAVEMIVVGAKALMPGLV